MFIVGQSNGCVKIFVCILRGAMRIAIYEGKKEKEMCNVQSKYNLTTSFYLISFRDPFFQSLRHSSFIVSKIYDIDIGTIVLKYYLTYISIIFILAAPNLKL